MSTHRTHFKLAVAALFSMACGCGPFFFGGFFSGVLGSGVVETESRDVGGFTDIEFFGAGRIEVGMGELQPVEVTADDNLLPLITTEVLGDTLIVRTTQPIVPSSGLMIRVTVPDLTSLSVEGSGDFVVSDIDNEEFSIAIIGSGDATVSGRTAALMVAVSGSAKINAGDLVGRAVEVLISGSGDAVVNAVDTLDITIEGSGAVRYAGNPTVSQTISGSGRVSPLD